MSFIRSGVYSWSYGRLYGCWSDGAYWSSRAHSGAYANALYFHGSNLGPRTGSVRGFSYAVRCVAR